MHGIADMPQDRFFPLLNPRDLGQAYKAERKALGKTQQDIATSTKYRRQTIIDLEAGRNVSMHTLFSALGALGKGLEIADVRAPTLDDLQKMFGNDDQY